MPPSRARPGCGRCSTAWPGRALAGEAAAGACDLMVDTGINRLGLPMATLGDPALARARDRHAACRTSPRPTRTSRRTRCSWRASREACARDPARAAAASPTAPGSRSGAGLSRSTSPARAWRSTAACRAPNWRRIRQVAPRRPRSCRCAISRRATASATTPTFIAPRADARRRGLARLCRRLPALLVGHGGVLLYEASRAAAARPGLDGHGGGRSRRRARRARRRLARSAATTCPPRPRAAACRNTNCSPLLGRRFAG